VMLWARWSTCRRVCASAAAGSRNSPPSENESGVTLSTHITNGRPLARSRVSTLPARAAPETDGPPRVTFAAVVLAAIAFTFMFFGGLVPLMALALRGSSGEVKRRSKRDLVFKKGRQR